MPGSQTPCAWLADVDHAWSRRCVSCPRADATATTDAAPVQPAMDPALAKDWLSRWEKSILQDARRPTVRPRTGESSAWIVSPFLEASITATSHA